MREQCRGADLPIGIKPSHPLPSWLQQCTGRLDHIPATGDNPLNTAVLWCTLVNYRASRKKSCILPSLWRITKFM